MANYYMVRAMQSSEAEIKVFTENNVVAVGWSDLNFCETEESSLRDKIWTSYYKDSNKRNQSISSALNQAMMFKGIKKGDRIIVPLPYEILLAEADDGEYYSESARTLDLANQHKVTFKYINARPKTIARKELSEGLQRRLRVRGRTVSNLYEFKEEIDKLFETEAYSYSEECQKKEKEEIKKFKEILLNHIKNGNTHLSTGGNGLEHLVREIMECEGYEAKVLAKNLFPGFADADVKAIKEDSFIEQKFLVQIKHHQGNSGDWGLKQLAEIRKTGDYSDYGLIFITSASISEQVQQEAKEMDIDVIDGNALVDLIYDNLDKISNDTKRLLGISLIPHMNN